MSHSLQKSSLGAGLKSGLKLKVNNMVYSYFYSFRHTLYCNNI